MTYDYIHDQQYGNNAEHVFCFQHFILSYLHFYGHPVKLMDGPYMVCNMKAFHFKTLKCFNYFAEFATSLHQYGQKDNR